MHQAIRYWAEIGGRLLMYIVGFKILLRVFGVQVDHLCWNKVFGSLDVIYVYPWIVNSSLIFVKSNKN
nr:hypothetical protein [Tanacetum cinerariifolium]